MKYTASRRHKKSYINQKGIMKCQNYTLKKTGCTKVAANSNRIEYETTVHYYPYKSKVLNLCENGFLYTFEETLGHESFQSSTNRFVLSEFDIRHGLNNSGLFRFFFGFVSILCT